MTVTEEALARMESATVNQDSLGPPAIKYPARMIAVTLTEYVNQMVLANAELDSWGKTAQLNSVLITVLEMVTARITLVYAKRDSQASIAQSPNVPITAANMEYA